jgi:hypothetical protein
MKLPYFHLEGVSIKDGPRKKILKESQIAVILSSLNIYKNNPQLHIYCTCAGPCREVNMAVN